MSVAGEPSSSTVAAGTVVVTARDILFSNYDSSTGKWGNAVMTMMILDSVTEGLEEFEEKVYAVFRNHEDPTDIVQFSAEVDGLDTRVTTSTPMVPSAKYELYKVYGQTSGDEYATTSQFYFQVPGKVWDFANDVVEEDVELVSDWDNYGCIKDVNDVEHGMTSINEVTSIRNGQATVDGVTYSSSDIKGIKLTNMVEGDVSNLRISSFNSLQELDIVASRMTKCDSILVGCSIFNQRFAFPETLQTGTNFIYEPPMFNQHVYFPDSLTQVGSLMQMTWANTVFTKKVRWPRNLSKVTNYIGGHLHNWQGSLVGLSENVQLQDIGSNGFYYADPSKGLPLDGEGYPIYRTPNIWTYVPKMFLGQPWENSTADLPFPSTMHLEVTEGIEEIRNNAFGTMSFVNKVVFPSTLTSFGASSHKFGNNNKPATVDASRCTLCDSWPLLDGVVDWSTSTMPPNATKIPNNWFARPAKNTLPINADGKRTFTFPEGIESIGNSFWSGVGKPPFGNGLVQRIEFPSTLTSIGSSFAYGYTQRIDLAAPIEVDFTKISPDLFERNGGADMSSFCCYAASTYQTCLKAIILPGTQERWEEVLPNISRVYNGNTHWTRHIEWVEKPTKYGYVFYETDYYATPVVGKGVIEIQSAADFAKLTNVNKSLGYSITLDVDDQGNTETVYFANATYNTSQNHLNTLTGVHVGTDVTTLPDEFLYYACFLKDFKFGKNTASVGKDFCYQAGTYLKAGDRTCDYDLANFPSTMTSIGDNFMYGAKYMNEEIAMPNGLTTIGQAFLRGCSAFNQPIVISNSVTTVGDYFMNECKAFNQPITFPSSVSRLWYALNSCTSFNSTVTIQNSSIQLTYFLQGCTSYNQPFTIPSNASTNGLLVGCTSFNQPITIPSTVTGIGYFLNNCTSFNSVVTFEPGRTTRASLLNFMDGCTSFNQPIDFSAYSTDFGQFSALKNCTSFNSAITLPAKVNGGLQLMNGCTSFNQPIVLPICTQINYGQTCSDWRSFNQPITIPASWGASRWYNWAHIFRNCDSLTSTVTMEATPAPDGQDEGVVKYSFSTDNVNAPSYINGITMTGTHAQDWANALPDSTTSPYRKINVV